MPGSASRLRPLFTSIAVSVLPARGQHPERLRPRVSVQFERLSHAVAKALRDWYLASLHRYVFVRSRIAPSTGENGEYRDGNIRGQRDEFLSERHRPLTE